MHLGSRACQAERLVRFLDRTESEQLYLVGDTLDAWKLRSRLYWPTAHSKVVGRILDKAAHGTRVTYLVGNHDDILRPLLVRKLSWGRIEMADEIVHETALGQRLLVTHGDSFDKITAIGFRPLSMAADVAYTQLMRANRAVNWVQAGLGRPPSSVSAWAKQRVKQLIQRLSGFEDSVVYECKRRKLSGMICGHTHHAEIRPIKNGITYYNCGDWVESCTALAEDADGHIRLIHQ